MRTGIRMTECDNSRTYVPEVRQYYGLVLFCFQPCKYHVGTRNSCYRRTYILYHMTFPNAKYSKPQFKFVCATLTYLGMKHDCADGTKECWSQLYVCVTMQLFSLF
jgi:hypothetical protein